MTKAQIDLQLRSAINAVFEHLLEDLKLETVPIDEAQNLYWDGPAPELYDMSKEPIGLTVGDLGDDVDFAKLIQRGQSGDASYNLVHVVPLLRYIAETVKK
jgi:hypothetical protein